MGKMLVPVVTNSTYTEQDADSKLMVQWNELVAERAAMMQPEPNSGLLGAIDSNPQPPGYESQSSIVYFPLGIGLYLYVPLTTSQKLNPICRLKLLG